jgi:hypothetical protein
MEVAAQITQQQIHPGVMVLLILEAGAVVDHTIMLIIEEETVVPV